MDGSPSSVLTLGLGTWGSVNLVVTLGLGQAEEAPQDITITNYPALRGLANASKTLRSISPASPELKGRQ